MSVSITSVTGVTTTYDNFNAAAWASQNERAALLDAEMQSILDTVEAKNQLVAQYQALIALFTQAVDAAPGGTSINITADGVLLTPIPMDPVRVAQLDNWAAALVSKANYFQQYSPSWNDPGFWAELNYGANLFAQEPGDEVWLSGSWQVSAAGAARVAAGEQLFQELAAEGIDVTAFPHTVDFTYDDGTQTHVLPVREATMNGIMAARQAVYNLKTAESLTFFGTVPDMAFLTSAGLDMTLAPQDGDGTYTITRDDLERWMGQLKTSVQAIDTSLTQEQVLRMSTLKEKWQETYALLASVHRAWTEALQSILQAMRT